MVDGVSAEMMLYQSTRDYGAVENIRSLKQKVEEAHGESAAGWNVKIDAGGIRDIEFIAQALQLLRRPHPAGA